MSTTVTCTIDIFFFIALQIEFTDKLNLGLKKQALHNDNTMIITFSRLDNVDLS